MVEQPLDYRWSSYHCNANGRYNKLISHHEIYALLGKNIESRTQAY